MEAASGTDLTLSFRREGYEALLALFDSVREGVTIKDLSAHALRIVQEITGFDTLVIRLHDHHREYQHLVAQIGMTEQMVEEVASIPMNRGFSGDATVKRWPVFTTDIASDPRTISPSTHREGFKSLLSVPLLAGEEVVGTMELISKQIVEWKDEELSWMALMGRSIGSLVGYLGMVERCKNQAIIAERARLAQEIHDGTIQQIGSLHFWSQAAQVAIQENRRDGVRTAVDRIGIIADGIFKGLREEILGLRVRVGGQEDIVSLLRQYLLRFQDHWGITTKLVLRCPGMVNLGLCSDVQLLRVVQESLSNVRRHAGASEVIVTIAQEDHSISVVIEDNGQGFDSRMVSPDHCGLRIMQERMESVGGAIQVSSALGKGTKIALSFPHEMLGLSHA